jgi:hypothetical protein
MKKTYLLPTLALSALLFYGCENATQDIKPNLSAETHANINVTASGADVINFEDLATGATVSEVYSANGQGPVKVWGNNPEHPGKNAAMIFNSAAPTGDDWDLGTTNEDFGGPGIGEGGEMDSPYANNVELGKVLIITEDFNSNDPDDANVDGVTLNFDFSALGNVTIYNMNVIDVDHYELPTTVDFYDASGSKIGSRYSTPRTGNNGLVLLQFGDGVSNVAKMVVTINGTGAIDNISFTAEKTETPAMGCTYTQGYWKTHSKYGPAKKRDNTWDKIGAKGEDSEFYLSGQTYIEVMNTAPKGNAYYILAPQYIAAKLNILHGASAPDEVKDAMKGAEDLFKKYTPAQVAAMKGAHKVRKQFIEYAETLDKYNNGLIGPGHCD